MAACGRVFLSAPARIEQPHGPTDVDVDTTRLPGGVCRVDSGLVDLFRSHLEAKDTV